MDIKIVINRVCNENNWNKSQIAKKLGLTRGGITRILERSGTVDISTAMKIEMLTKGEYKAEEVIHENQAHTIKQFKKYLEKKNSIKRDAGEHPKLIRTICNKYCLGNINDLAKLLETKREHLHEIQAGLTPISIKLATKIELLTKGEITVGLILPEYEEIMAELKGLWKHGKKWLEK